MLAKCHTTRLYPDILLGFISQVKKLFYYSLPAVTDPELRGGKDTDYKSAPAGH